MSVESHKETKAFQAEVSQVLDLVIRSLYSNKEIFLRELVSNASDAIEKLRFESLTDESLLEGDGELRIRLMVDKEAGTLTVSDNGIGMSRDEVTETIGSIASSGTRKFLEQMTGDAATDSQLIGQFGVGFYSAFIVADKVTLLTRRAGLPAGQGVRWESTGDGEYSIETIEKPQRGTDVILHLKEDEKEFLEPWRLRSIITKFSDHIAVPIEMLSEPTEEGEEPKWEQINKGTALWQRNRSEITDEEYKEFYKTISHDFEDPLAWVHTRVEGKNEYTSLLYIPSQAPFDLFDRESKHGVKLYVRRVFIMDEADKLMPMYLRFVKGVVDADDLPLNVSREILQHNRKIDAIRTGNVKRILGLLEKMARDEAEKYAKFWKEFGRVMKEGPAEDFANRERIAGLLRFRSTQSDDETVSLDAYIERMKPGQERIYYITADTLAAARNSPHLEVFKKKGIEVLLLTDRVDEWLMSHLTEYKEKPFQNVAKGTLDLSGIESGEEDADEEKKEHAELDEKLVERLKKVLGDAVKEIRPSERLTDSPACLVVEENDMSSNLARVLAQLGQDAPKPVPTMELNPDHPLIARLKDEADDERFSDLARILFDQAMLAEGGQLEDPASFVHRLNKLMLSLSND